MSGLDVVSAPVADGRTEYNAAVVAVNRVHEDLIIVRVRPDDGVPQFTPGQYTTLGLQSDEPRVDGVPLVATASPRSIRRAYSISHSLVDDDGNLVTCNDCDHLEFYIALVRKPSDDPPSLTPRLFRLNIGDRLFVGPKISGRYVMSGLQPSTNIIFAATGTGESPHNAMLAELLSHKNQGRVVSIVSTRYRRDLAYLDSHRQLEQRFGNYRYIPLTTREAENVDPTHSDFVGKRYIQDLFSSDDVNEELGWSPDPANTHVFLCGNPAMIGLPKRGHHADIFPKPTGMIETLTGLGFERDRPRQPGNIHFEKYW